MGGAHVVIKMDAALGLRVVRGPDWEWGDQDGGEGFLGTVAGLEEGGGAVIVQWDMGPRCRYRCGQDNKFDLRVLDSGPSGHSFSTLLCHVCRKERIPGAVWKCIACSEYYLCSACYLAGHHCMVHRFACLLSKDGKHFRVPSRGESRCVPAKGLFVGAVVERGVDWRWKDQDGGEGGRGKVVEVTGWMKKDSLTEHSVVVVVWQNGNRKKYRAGHKGKMDVKCVSPGSGVSYYPEHLPVLGGHIEPPPAHEFVSGDKVRCEVDMDILSSLQDNPVMAEKIGLMLDHVGTVNSLMEDGDLLVRYPSNTLLPVNPQAAKKVAMPEFDCGDVVRMVSDLAEAYRLQQGHGGWNDDMALCLGQVGTVVKSVGDGNVRVHIAGYRWVLNPYCLEHAPGEELAPDTNPGRQLLPGLGLLVDSFGPGILVHATSNGDMATVQAFLEKNPDQVNAMEQGKTAVHVAVEEARLKILKLLLAYKPNLSQMDGDGDTPLHTAAFLNGVQAAMLLLDAGADVNSKNVKRSITPVMIAGAVGHFKLLEVLANHHTADVNVQDLQGQTALHHALSSQRTRAIPILLRAGADLTLLNTNFFHPLMDACGFGFLPGVEDIVRQRPDVKDVCRPTDNLTALHLASVNSRLYVVRHLALSGCDLNLRNELQRTALHITSIEGYSHIMECLVGHGIDINARDNDGNTVLHIVLIKKNSRPLSHYTPQMNKIHNELSRLPLDSVPVFLTVACFLVQEGADMKVRNNRGQTAAQASPADKRDVLINYINKSNRGEFHGSLRNDKSAVSTENASTNADNKSNVLVKDQSDTQKSSLAISSTSSDKTVVHRSDRVTTLKQLEEQLPSSRLEGGASMSHQGSIMQAQHHVMGGGRAGGHRERDRLKFLEGRKTRPTDGEPHVLSVEEREKVRQRREAYFGSQDRKNEKGTTVSVEKKAEDTSKQLSTSGSTEKQSSGKEEHTVETKTVERKTVSERDKGRDKQSKREAGDEKRDSRSEETGQLQRHKHLVPVKGKTEVQPGGSVMEKGVKQQKRTQEKVGDRQGKGFTGVKDASAKNSEPVATVDQQSLTDGRDSEIDAVLKPPQLVKDGANAAEPCFVCEMPADASFIPCGHVVACKRCASRAKRCPICKTMVNGVS